MDGDGLTLGGTARRLRPLLDDVIEDDRLRALAVVMLVMLVLGLAMVGAESLGGSRDPLVAGGDCAADGCASSAVGSGPTALVAADPDTAATSGPDPSPGSPSPGDATGERSPAGDAPGSDDGRAEATGGVEAAPSATAAPTDQVEDTAVEDAAPPAPEALFRPARAPESEELPARRLPYERFAAQPSQMLARLPSLDVLAARFPTTAMTSDIGAQKEHIRRLDERAEVTVEGYEAFEADTSRRDAFADLPDYDERIRPRMFIVHWTAMGYRDVDHFIRSLRPYRVQFFIDHHAEAYDLFEADDHKPAHAHRANDFSQGVEIETGPFDGARSPLLQYTPEQITQTVYVAVDFLRRNDLPVDETTLVGHYAADLIFSNPYYDPHDGTFTRDRIRKFDPPQELMEVIVRKAEELDAALDADEDVGPGPDPEPEPELEPQAEDEGEDEDGERERDSALSRWFGAGTERTAGG